MDIWRDEYNRIPANKKSKDASGSIRNLLMQDLWLYLKGRSEGKSGVEALGGGRNKKELARVKRKRDGLMRFLGFEKNDQMLTNANMFEQILDKNRIIKSFRLDRMQNLEISDHPATITDAAHKRVQTNTLPANRASFMGAKSDVIPALNVQNEPSFPYADQIVDGKKTIETRRQSNLDKLIGKTVKIIRTTGPKSKEPAMVIGEVTITGKKEYKNLKSFREDSDKHLVSEGSGFDFDKPKIGYTLENAKRYAEEYPAMKNKGIVYTNQHDGPRNIVSDAAPDASEQTSREQSSIPEGDVPGGDDQTLPIYYDRDSKGNIKYEKKDKPKILQENYDFLGSPLVKSIIDEAGDSVKAKKELAEIVTSLNTSKLDDRNKLTPDQQKLYDKIVDQYSDAFAEDFGKWKDDPDILSAIGWYSGVAKNIGKLIPNDADRHIFLEFLGGTSPNTSVEQNFLYAIDLFNRWKSGGLKQYVDARDKTIEAFKDGSLIEQFIEQSETPVYERFKDGKLKKDKKGQKIQKVVDKEPVFEYKWKSAKARNRYVKLFADAESGTKSKKDYEKSVAKARKKAKSITPVDIYHVGLFDAGAIPVRKNGGKYGVHTERVFQIVEGIWERDTDAPKAVNFTGNLKGTRTTATIDVWAARFLRRIGYEKGNAPWRIQPSAEPGVKNADFYFGQDAFEAATKKITRDYGEKFNMTPDDLQAVMWFAEKRNWAQKGWSRVEDFGDFRDYLYKMQQESDGSLKLKDAVLRATSEDFYKSLEFPAEDVQLPTASRKRRVEIVDKIVSVGKRIERARLKVVKSKANFDKAQGKIESAKTDAAKKRTKATALAKKKILQQAQKSLSALHDELRSVREIRMTLEEKPVTYSR